MKAAHGKYTGTGSAGLVVPSPVSPTFLFVKGESQVAIVTISTMGADQSKDLRTMELFAGGITALGTNQFTVGTDARANASGTDYYWWAVEDDGASDIAAFSYTGDGTDSRDITDAALDFDPLLVIVMRGDSSVVGGCWVRTNNNVGDESMVFGGIFFNANRIQAFGTQSFQVGTNAAVNTNLVTYHALCLGANAAEFDSFTYTGDGTDDRNIDTLSLTPGVVSVQADGGAFGSSPVYRTAEMLGDNSMAYREADGLLANQIQALRAAGFQVGTSDRVNTAAVRHIGWALKYRPATLLVDPDQYRLMLSDGADPDVPVLNITPDDIGKRGDVLIRVERGRESAVLGMPARAGQADARLNNTALPYGMDEPTPGLALRLNKGYGGDWYHLWQGNLDVPEHEMTMFRPQINVRALGPLTKLANRKGSTELYQDISTGEAIGHLLDAVGFPSALRALDHGDVTLPYWWMNDEDALTALWTLVNSEGITAELYEAGDGKLTFRSRLARYDETRSNTIQTTFRSAGAKPWLSSFQYTTGYREVVNYASHERYRRTNDTGVTVVWSDTPDFDYAIPANGSIVVEAVAAQPFFDAITPVANTDFLYGFDAPTVTLERTSGQRTKITFTSGVNGTTLTALQLRATATINNATYVEVSAVNNAASVAAYGLRPWGGTMSKELSWADMRDNLDAIVTWKQQPRGRVRFSINAAQSAEANQATAQRLIGDRIRVIEADLDFDGECWIERFEHEIRAPAGPADGTTTVGWEQTTYECSVISVAVGSSGSGVSDTSPYPNNGVYVGSGLDDEGITMRGASSLG